MVKSASSDLSIRRILISDLKPDPRNPRRHSDRQISQIARSIAAFGFNVPVLIDRDNHVPIMVLPVQRRGPAQLCGQFKVD
jgi:hypothetical protein